MSILNKIKSLINSLPDAIGNQKKSLIIICVLTALSFSNIIFNSFILDDFDFIVNWSLIKDLSNFPRFFVGYFTPDGQEGIYSPLRTLFFAVNYFFCGMNPIGYHLVSIIIHLAGTIAVYMITSLLVQNRIISFITALFFGLHPVHVESVTSITGSIDTIGVVLLFYSFYFYIKATGYEDTLVVEDGDVVWKDKQRVNDAVRKVKSCPIDSLMVDSRSDYYYALMFAFISIYTHELAVTLPVLFLLYDYFFRGAKIPFKILFKRLLPFFVISISYVFMKWAVLGAISRGTYLFDSFYLHMLVIIKAWGKNIWTIIFPLRLCHNQVISPGIFSYDESDFDKNAVLSQSIFEPRVLISLAVLGTLVFLAIKLYRKKPLISFCIAWFFFCLLPVCGIIPSSIYFAERYLYPGSMSFCILVSYVIYKLLMSTNKNKQLISIILSIFLVMFYSIRTFTRNFDARNQMTVYESTVRENPYSARMQNDMGIVYYQFGKHEKAIESFKRAIKINPREAHYYYSMEKPYSALEKYDESEALLKKAIEINPFFAEAYYNLAGLQMYLGKKDESLKNMNKAIDLHKQQGRILEAGRLKVTFYSYIKMRKKFIDGIFIGDTDSKKEDTSKAVQ